MDKDHVLLIAKLEEINRKLDRLDDRLDGLAANADWNWHHKPDTVGARLDKLLAIAEWNWATPPKSYGGHDD